MSAKKSGNENNITKLRLSMIFGYTAVIVGIIIIISALILKKTDDVLKSKVSEMTSSLTVQMKMNMNSYLSKLETTGTLVFATKEVYTYSASDETVDGYEAIRTEDIISDKLFSLCIMENFVDFGIVYDNNHTVGKVSNGTVDLFGDDLYTDLSAMINRKRTDDGWSAGYNGDFKRVYYVKRINESAVLVISFYTTELEEVFEHPGGLNDITVRLADNNNSIIYSSLGDETGKALPYEITSRIENRTSATVMDDEYLVTVNVCGDDWKVICSVPTQVILKEKNDVKIYITLIAAAASMFAFFMSAALSRRISDPVGDMLSRLAQKASIDQLTRLLNKRSFEEIVEHTLKAADDQDKFCMMLIDLDDFKTINDTFGHAAGDKVLADAANVMSRLYGNYGYLGRLGGDEFCVFLEIPKTVSDSEQYMIDKCTELNGAFRSKYADDAHTHRVSLSVGAVFSNAEERSFAELYKKADKALYRSKDKGKDTFSIYSSEDEK